MFLASIPYGYMSGYLIDRFLPDEEHRDCKTLWFLVGLLVL